MNQPTRVLVVDDEPVVLQAAGKILTPLFSLDTAPDAGSALQKLAGGSYQIVLTDLMLPRTSGLELLQQAWSKAPSTQGILMTGYATVAKAVNAIALGAFDFVAKPFEVEELLGVVTRASRYVDRAQEGPSLQGRYLLGRHSWAALEADRALIGAGATFDGTVGSTASIEFVTPGTDLAQGDVCARITGSDDLLHLVRTPLSGTVTAVNSELGAPGGDRRLVRDWLIQLTASNLRSELQNLKLYGS